MLIKDFAEKDRRALTEALLTGNTAAFEETHAPDLITHIPPFPDAKGIEAYKQFVADMRKAFTGLRMDWDEMVVEGNTIAHRFTLHMKHTGHYPAIPVPPEGKEVVIKGSVFLHVKDGKIVEAFQYGDWLGMFQQLGIVQPTG